MLETIQHLLLQPSSFVTTTLEIPVDGEKSVKKGLTIFQASLDHERNNIHIEQQAHKFWETRKTILLTAFLLTGSLTTCVVSYIASRWIQIAVGVCGVALTLYFLYGFIIANKELEILCYNRRSSINQPINPWTRVFNYCNTPEGARDEVLFTKIWKRITAYYYADLEKCLKSIQSHDIEKIRTFSKEYAKQNPFALQFAKSDDFYNRLESASDNNFYIALHYKALALSLFFNECLMRNPVSDILNCLNAINQEMPHDWPTIS